MITEEFDKNDFTGNAWDRYDDFQKTIESGELVGKEVQVIRQMLKEGDCEPWFGDYLKRYIDGRYKSNSPDRNDAYYEDFILNSFRNNETPVSFGESSTTPRAKIKIWLKRRVAKRESVFLLGFGLKMKVKDVNEFLTKALYEQEINPKDPFEVICYYCYKNRLRFNAYEAIWDKYQKKSKSELAGVMMEETQMYRNSMYAIETEEQLWSYLSKLKDTDGIATYSRTAKNVFIELYDKACQIISTSPGHTEKKEITAYDFESILYSGIPKDGTGNLVTTQKSDVGSVIYGKKLSRQRIKSIINGKIQATRYDLITLNFFIFASPEKPKVNDFIANTNEILKKCSMNEMIIQNSFENMIMRCMLTEDPIGTFNDILEDSYENSYEIKE